MTKPLEQANLLNQPIPPKPETIAVVKYFVKAVNTFQWNNDYHQFCKILGWQEDNQSLKKWEQFKHLSQSLTHLDIETLAKIIEAVDK